MALILDSCEFKIFKANGNYVYAQLMAGHNLSK